MADWRREGGRLVAAVTVIYRVFRPIGGVSSSKNVCKLTSYFSFEVPAIRRVVEKMSISRRKSINNRFCL